MAKAISGTGQYKAPSGEQVTYTFEYQAYDNLQDAVAVLGEAEVLALTQRMTKVDASNTSREKAKVANGHSARKVMTEEDKAEAKAERQANKALLDAIKGKGITSLADLKRLIG